MASSIYRAFREYKDLVEQSSNSNDLKSLPSVKKANDVYYKILLSSSTQKINTNSKAWKVVKELEIAPVKNGYQYLGERCKSYSVALQRQSFYRKNGFPDAGIIAFNGNKRIPLSSAKELLGE
jgi:hypothetical protein